MSRTDSAGLFQFDNSYARLPERFYQRIDPTPVAAPSLIRVNAPLARELGLDPSALTSPEAAAILAGNVVAPGSEPLAMAYAGHQFGNFVPQLGDGRAILIGEVIDIHGVRRDIHLKGAGRTRFSRRGDGRAALGPVLREYIVSEAMAALGIPTTRTLAAVATGEQVLREGLLPGAVLARVAAGHARVGTFEYFAARRDIEALRALADYAIARHYPACREAANPYRAFLDAVIAAQADLIAKWLLVGFIHGVMNTDNMTISGETIDFGPCAFMDFYNPRQVYSSIDARGRYAYANQPTIGHWNLVCLAETLVPLLAETEEAGIAEAEHAMAAFGPKFEAAYRLGLTRKLGLGAAEEDTALALELLRLMADNEADFTLSFRRLSEAALDPAKEAGVRSLFKDPAALEAWLPAWRGRLRDAEGMRAVNPAFIARNHLVEDALAAAVRDGDFGPFETLLEVLTRPFDDQPGREVYGLPPRPEQVVTRTFCGT
ncbi:MAG: YdiU family protein [Rhodospirillaceae bacterium]|nr:YdiU family protein [Rhodospirillaceae bacterium]